MILVDWEIDQARLRGDILINPFLGENLQPASLDVCLSNKFKVMETPSAPDHSHKLTIATPILIDPQKTEQIKWKEYVEGEFYLYPYQFMLGSTQESISLKNGYVARLEGKSSLARLGLVIHSTAGFIDPGFRGNVTLELFNMNRWPIKLISGMKIGQLSFFKSSKSDRIYGDEGLGSKYQDSYGTVESRYGE